VLDGLERLHETVGDTAAGTSPAARLATLRSALQTQANMPGDRNLARATLSAAEAMATTLANASETVLSVRDDADAAMALAVDRLNGLLAEFEVVNAAIVRGTFAGDDVTDMMDRRDGLLGKISADVGVTVLQRDQGDVALYTDGGVTLFDRTARTVSFDTTPSLGPGITGNPVIIDGIPVTGANATMPLRAGTLAGLAALRDEIAPTCQAQLDEIARGLIEAFAEHDQSGGGGPDLAGLFTYAGGPGLPAAGVLSSGLALAIRVHAGVDPAAGGSLERLRDGGLNGPDYLYNPAGAASFADRLNETLDEIAAARSFDAASGLQSGVNVADFAVASVSWLEDQRQTASRSADYQQTLLART
jgi:flagellar hook-associated protein 1 FlgK